MLFLEKDSSVYYEEDKYSLLSDRYISADDEDWKQYQDRVQTTLAEVEDKAPSSYGLNYTDSTEMEDILQVTENTFVVEVLDIYAESEVNPTTVYNARIKQTIKNEPTDNNDILITFFDDTVKTGEEYIVLLADATETAPVYTLSSRESVYRLDEAKSIPALDKLLDDADEFETTKNKQSDEDILKEEQEADN